MKNNDEENEPNAENHPFALMYGCDDIWTFSKFLIFYII